MDVAERGVLGLGAPPGQLPGPADAGDPVVEERLVAAFQELGSIRVGAGGDRRGRAFSQPRKACQSSAFFHHRRTSQSSYQSKPSPYRGVSAVRAARRRRSTSGSVPATSANRLVIQLLVVGGHDRVEGIRMSQVEQRHLGAVR